MPNRRGRGEGSIVQRDDGRWMVRIDLGRGLDGLRQRKCLYAATQAEAVRLLRKQGGRRLLQTSTPTVAAYLEDWYQTNCDNWRASTRRSYQGAIDLYLVPAFGTRRLEQLSPVAIQAWLTLLCQVQRSVRLIQ